MLIASKIKNPYFLVSNLALCIFLSSCASGSVSQAEIAFLSTPPTSASEGVLYTYSVIVTASEGRNVSLTLSSAPENATLSGSVLSWTPTHQQARVSNEFVITARGPNAVSATQGFTLVPDGNIDGSQIVDFVFPDGSIQQVPDDLSQMSIAALVPTASGGYTRIPGTGDSQGKFVIPGVPAGPYLLQIGPFGSEYYWTSRSDLDMGYQTQTPVFNAQAQGTANYNIGLNFAIGANDIFEQDPGGFSLTSPVPLNGTTFSLSALGPLMTGNSLSLFVTHLLFNQVQGYNYYSVSEALGPIPPPAISNNVQNFTGMMQVPPAETIRGNIQGFTAYDSQMMPGGISQHLSGISFQFGAAYPNATAPSWERVDSDAPFSYGPLSPVVQTQNTCLVFPPTPCPTPGDVDLGDLSYADPFPGNYQRYVTVQRILTPPTTIANGDASFAANIFVETLMAPTASTPIHPMISPVTSVTLDGVSLSTAPTGVRLTPELAWQPPALGTASFYGVRIYSSQNVSGQAEIGLAASIQTNQTSITLPPGILAPGTSYFVFVSAYAGTVGDIESTPRRVAVPFGFADAVSPQFSTSN